jgi:hypothetical protein
MNIKAKLLITLLFFGLILKAQRFNSSLPKIETEHRKMGLGAELAYIKVSAESHITNAFSFVQAYTGYVCGKNILVSVKKDPKLYIMRDTVMYYHDITDSLIWVEKLNNYLRKEINLYQALQIKYNMINNQIIATLSLRQKPKFFQRLNRHVIRWGLGHPNSYSPFLLRKIKRQSENYLIEELLKSSDYLTDLYKNEYPLPPLIYRGLAKDKNGNIIPGNTELTVEYSIYELTKDKNKYTVYSNTEITTTDKDGLITLILDGKNTFNDLKWGKGEHFLKLQIKDNPKVSIPTPINSYTTTVTTKTCTTKTDKDNCAITMVSTITNDPPVTGYTVDTYSYTFNPTIVYIASDLYSTDTSSGITMQEQTGAAAASSTSTPWSPASLIPSLADVYTIVSGVITTVQQTQQTKTTALITYLQAMQMNPISSFTSGSGGSNQSSGASSSSQSGSSSGGQNAGSPASPSKQGGGKGHH